MKTTLAVVLSSILVCATRLAGADQYGDFQYSSDGTTITILGYTGTSPVITIPDRISELPVANIGPWAFYGANTYSIIIPDAVGSIGESAFRGCGSLTNLNIPNSVTNIGLWAFSGCSGLTSITVEALNPAFCGTNGVLFNKTITTLIQCPSGKTGGYAIPDGVTFIEVGALIECWNLTNITIPSSVGSIGRLAFAQCCGLKSVTIPGSVTNLGDGVFSDAPCLVRAFFTGNCPTAGANLFSSYARATVYYLPGTTGWEAAFGGLPALLWNPQAHTTGPDPGSNNGFGFIVTGTPGIPFAVEGSTSLGNPSWATLKRFFLTNGSVYFCDPDSTNYPARFYRLRSP